MISNGLFLKKNVDGKSIVCFESFSLPEIQSSELLLRFISSAINPADINMIDQRYLIKPTLPFSLGNEGVFRVVQVGKSVKGFKEGDRVILPFKSESFWQGGWSHYIVSKPSFLIKVPERFSDDLAAMLTVNPLTAYLLLTDQRLVQNSLLIQNAANSHMGRWIAYFANKFKLSCFHIVRSSKAKESLPSWMQKNAFEFSDRLTVNMIFKNEKASLALNAVGGDQARFLAKCLRPHGHLICYGAMAKQPLSFGNALFIFQNIVLKGFNRSRWLNEQSTDVVQQVYQRMFEIIDNDVLSILPIADRFPFSAYVEALNLSEAVSGKVLFVHD